MTKYEHSFKSVFSQNLDIYSDQQFDIHYAFKFFFQTRYTNSKITAEDFLSIKKNTMLNRDRKLQ